MALDRWNPFQDMLSLRDAMDRLMQESFVRPGGFLGFSNQMSLPLDMAESGNEFIVRASLPGMKPEDVQITVQGDVLTIRGETRAEEEQKGQQWIMHEHRSGTFQRTVRLPTPVNADQAQATHENGILTLTLPKSEAARARQISINAQPQIGTQGRTDEAAGRPTVAQQGQATGPNVTQTGYNPVSEASTESFPASDSPSWSQGQPG